jgi:hypothetical protein
MAGLLNLLSSAADVVDTPRQLVWQGISGLAGKNYRGAADALADAGMDPDSPLTKGLGFAGDVATDPLTWAGALAGGGAARGLFSAFGPRYGADAAKLAALEIPEALAGHGGASLAAEALASPHAAGILNEIPGGSKVLGAGAESLALGTPEGDVLKLSRFDPKAAVNLPDLPEINNPTRRQFFGNMEVSRVPLASNVGDEAMFNQSRPALEEALRGAGLDVYDLKPEDVGMVGGRPKVLDMGSLDTLTPSGPPRALAGQVPGRNLYRGMAGGAGAAKGGGSLLGLLKGGADA